MEPRSFIRDQNPGIPRNFRDFMKDVAFMIYTFPAVRVKMLNEPLLA